MRDIQCVNLFVKLTWNFQRQAKTKASDLNETGIDLELMHLQRSGESFDVSKFYKVSTNRF